MTHSVTTPTPRRYGPPPVLGVTSEADGFLATCACKWLRWWADEKAAQAGYAKHVKGCKAHRVVEA